MANNKSDTLSPTLTQICVLKVNLQCCKACPQKVNKKLQKIKGVHFINIDTKEGLVIVAGLLDDPALLINTIEEIGITAELLAYEKNSMRAKKKLDHLLKNMHKVKDHQRASLLEDYSDTATSDHNHGYANAGYKISNDHALQRSDTNTNSTCWHHPNYEVRRVFPGPRQTFARPNYVHPSMVFYNRSPPPPRPRYVRWTRPPLPYPFSIYEQQEQDIGNAFHHILSDENVGACCIM